MRVAVTVDLHDDDDPDDIRAACETLRERAIRASFFVPARALCSPAFRAAALEIVRNGHEAAAHSYAHDEAEMFALMHGRAIELGFLATAKKIHEEVFGAPPTAFRSPCWCHLGDAAVATLVELGFIADSSATPQRLALLSSTPFDYVWTFASRRLRYLVPELLEVPTSTLLVPAAWPTFLTIRSLSPLLVGVLALECRLLPGRVLTLQLHASGFRARTPEKHRHAEKLTLASFFPRRTGGIEFRKRLRCGDPVVMASVTSALLDTMRDGRYVSISDVAAEHRAGVCVPALTCT
ncbi:MAG TPA: polysaccharide deacetylase family protein [Thermoanaerobaculia bacterium]|nr:polysaccharide deacetylase family protein [Thermoanaerobaculia bacterium]